MVWYSHLLKNFPVCCALQSPRLWHSQKSRNRCFSGSLLLFRWSSRCWQFDLWFLCQAGIFLPLSSVSSQREEIIFEGVLFSLSFFKTTLLTYDQHTESCTCLMNLETSIQPWNHLYYLCHKHIHYHQKVFFLPSLFICYYYSLKEFSIALQVLLLLKLYTFLKVIHNMEIFSSINIGKVFKNKIPVITRQN